MTNPPPDKTTAQLAAIRAFVSGTSAELPSLRAAAAHEEKKQRTHHPKPRTRSDLMPEHEPPQPAADPKAKKAEAPQAGEQPQVQIPDPVALTNAFLHLAERGQPIMRDWLERIRLQPQQATLFPMQNASELWLQTLKRISENPRHLLEAQIGLWQDYLKLWQCTSTRMMGGAAEPVIAPAPNDKRFQDAAWTENVMFDFIKQSYLLAARWTQSSVQDIQGIEPPAQRKVDFYIRQFVDAMSPSNFAMTNPEVLRRTAETGGQNLIKGLENLMEDLERGKGELRISMTDMKAFTLGKNIATTPGKVIYQNDLIQLIQYEPLQETAHQVPLLIIPPWINKYYILDLKEKNSLVRWCLEQGFTVFMISWVNPDERHRDKDFGDYMMEGPLAAAEQIKRITGQDEVNIIGYCLGGTLLASTLGYLAKAKANPKLPKVNSATYLVTLVDFADCGEISVFIDDEQIAHMEALMKQKGYLDAAAMATSFNLLRANDLIWSFVVNNYLMGREPFPFDLLYWNADSTRLPAAMHSFYLRNMYKDNKLVQKDALSIKGIPIDLSKVETPSFLLSTRDDHITPWKGTYAATQLYGGPVNFVLSGSGHIAGVINSPTVNKYCYWTNSQLPAVPDQWFETAEQQQGSWWPEWYRWISEYAGPKIPAIKPDIKGALENAPGSYVKVRSL